jgi:thymidine phosphorylase
MRLGAGRITKDDTIDHAVGVVCLRKRGDRVEAGGVLAEIHAQDEASADASAADVLGAYDLSEEEPTAAGVILDTLR